MKTSKTLHLDPIGAYFPCTYLGNCLCMVVKGEGCTDQAISALWNRYQNYVRAQEILESAHIKDLVGYSKGMHQNNNNDIINTKYNNIPSMRKGGLINNSDTHPNIYLGLTNHGIELRYNHEPKANNMFKNFKDSTFQQGENKRRKIFNYMARKILHVTVSEEYPGVLAWIYKHEGSSKKLLHECRCHAILLKETGLDDRCKGQKLTESFSPLPGCNLIPLLYKTLHRSQTIPYRCNDEINLLYWKQDSSDIHNTTIQSTSVYNEKLNPKISKTKHQNSLVRSSSVTSTHSHTSTHKTMDDFDDSDITVLNETMQHLKRRISHLVSKAVNDYKTRRLRQQHMRLVREQNSLPISLDSSLCIAQQQHAIKIDGSNFGRKNKLTHSVSDNLTSFAQNYVCKNLTDKSIEIQNKEGSTSRTKNLSAQNLITTSNLRNSGNKSLVNKKYSFHTSFSIDEESEEDMELNNNISHYVSSPENHTKLSGTNGNKTTLNLNHQSKGKITQSNNESYGKNNCNMKHKKDNKYVKLSSQMMKKWKSHESLVIPFEQQTCLHSAAETFSLTSMFDVKYDSTEKERLIVNSFNPSLDLCNRNPSMNLCLNNHIKNCSHQHPYFFNDLTYNFDLLSCHYALRKNDNLRRKRSQSVPTLSSNQSRLIESWLTAASKSRKLGSSSRESGFDDIMTGYYTSSDCSTQCSSLTNSPIIVRYQSTEDIKETYKSPSSNMLNDNKESINENLV